MTIELVSASPTSERTEVTSCEEMRAKSVRPPFVEGLAEAFDIDLWFEARSIRGIDSTMSKEDQIRSAIQEKVRPSLSFSM